MQALKTYVVQRASGEVLTVKLTFGAAQAVAKAEAPARVMFFMADKLPTLAFESGLSAKVSCK